MRRLSIILLMLITFIVLALPELGWAQAQLTPAVDYTFGSQVDFSVSLPLDQIVESVQVLFRNAGDAETFSGQMNINGSQAIYTHDLASQPLHPFSTVEYWFVITPPGEAPTTTDVNSFQYIDNRFHWQTLEDEQFRVHWYEGDVGFGQSVLEAARAGAERAQSLLPVSVVEPIDIYVYASGKELQSALRVGGLNWVAGHADPDLNLVLVSLPPGPDQSRETERQIPHELMHILLYQAVEAGYKNLPTWFNEGLATTNELRPNSDYFLILENAVEDDSLISLEQLCESFPKDSSVYLAYAESGSFVRYLHQEYGTSGLGNLLQSYAGGASCALGPVPALGKPLDRLESDWRRQELGEYALLSALMNMLPWLLVLGIVIVVPLSMIVFSLRKKATKKTAKASYG